MKGWAFLTGEVDTCNQKVLVEGSYGALQPLRQSARVSCSEVAVVQFSQCQDCEIFFLPGRIVAYMIERDISCDEGAPVCVDDHSRAQFIMVEKGLQLVLDDMVHFLESAVDMSEPRSSKS